MKKQNKAKHIQLSKDKRVAGVTSGIAQYYQKDPALVRVLAVTLIILTGIIPGIIMYYLLYILLKQSTHK